MADRRRLRRALLPVEPARVRPRAPRRGGARHRHRRAAARDSLDPELRHWLFHYEQIGNVTDEGAAREGRALAAAEGARRPARGRHRGARHGGRARARALRHPGHQRARRRSCAATSPSMKEALREAGVPCAPVDRQRTTPPRSATSPPRSASRSSSSRATPPAPRARSASTTHASSTRALASFGVDRGRSVAVEEFIEGHEGFYDTLTIGGAVVHDFVCHYYPNVLEAMRARWISPQFVSTNRLDSAPGYAGAAGDGPARSSRRSASRRRPRTWSGSPGRRGSSSARSAAARRACARGISTPRATTSTSTASGRWRSFTAASSQPLVSPLRRGRHRAPSRVRRAHRRLRRHLDEVERRFGPLIIDAHFPPPGHAHAAGRRRLHGQRVDAHEAPRLRPAPRDARLRRAHGEGARAMKLSW